MQLKKSTYCVLRFTKQTLQQCSCDVCFTPESGHVQCTSSCLLWAKSRHRQSLLDDFISARKKSLRHFEAKCLRRLKVDSEFVFSWCLYRKVSRFLALEDAIDVSCPGTK